jgi:hypothetical protein
MVYFLSMLYVVCYHLVKFELKTHLCIEKQKNINYAKG